jgi:hypothetical protein
MRNHTLLTDSHDKLTTWNLSGARVTLKNIMVIKHRIGFL